MPHDDAGRQPEQTHNEDQHAVACRRDADGEPDESAGSEERGGGLGSGSQEAYE
jgi:hypothetical protein